MKYIKAITISLILFSAILPLQASTLKAKPTAKEEVNDLIKQKDESRKKDKQKKVSSADIKDQLKNSKKSYTQTIKAITTSSEFIALCISAAFCAGVYYLYKSMNPPPQLTKKEQQNIIERVKMEMIPLHDPRKNKKPKGFLERLAQYLEPQTNPFKDNVALLPLSTGRCLHSASDTEQADVLDRYFKTGADPNDMIQVGHDSVNLAANAAHYGFANSFRTALNHGYKVSSDLLFEICDPTAEENQKTKKLFLSQDLAVLKLALDQKPDLDARDRLGQTVLHRVKDSKVQALLIAAGANVDAVDNLGNKPQLTFTNQCNLRLQAMQHELLEKLKNYYAR